MRLAVIASLLLSLASGSARADEPAPAFVAAPPAPPRQSLRAANRLLYGGIAVLTLGVIATVLGQVLIAHGLGWGLESGLGENIEPTPAWVGEYETDGAVTLAAGNLAIISGVTMLSVGSKRRHQARASLGLSLAPTRSGAAAGVVLRF